MSLAGDVRGLRRTGLGWRAIARELGTTRDRVRGAVRRKQRKARPGACVTCGAPITQLLRGRARKYCLAHGPRRAPAKRALWSRRSATKRRAEIARRRVAGEGYKAIASALGLTRDQIRDDALRMGLGGVRGPHHPPRAIPRRRLADATRCEGCGAGLAQLRRGRPRAHCEDCLRAMQAARVRVREAVARGELVRPTSCPRCGAAGRIEAHHTDYARPLEVVFACASCHRAAHRDLARATSDRAA